MARHVSNDGRRDLNLTIGLSLCNVFQYRIQMARQLCPARPPLRLLLMIHIYKPRLLCPHFVRGLCVERIGKSILGSSLSPSVRREKRAYIDEFTPNTSLALSSRPSVRREKRAYIDEFTPNCSLALSSRPSVRREKRAYVDHFTPIFTPKGI